MNSTKLPKIYATDNPVRDIDGLVRLVAQFSVMALITKVEDERLRATKLQSKMPLDWDGKDMFARYKAVGIVVEPVPE